MDVRLPDGTVIRGVPDGMSKDDLVAKLQNNGYDVSWYKPETPVKDFLTEHAPWQYKPDQTTDQALEEYSGKSFPQQVAEGAVGGVEAMTSMASMVPAMIGKGLGMGVGYALGDDPMEYGRRVEESLTYNPRTSAGQALAGLGGEAFEAAKGGVGMAMGGAGGAMAQARAAMNPSLYKEPTQEQLAAGFNEEARALGEVGFEGGLFVAPMRGVHKAYKFEKQAEKRLAEKEAKQAEMARLDAERLRGYESDLGESALPEQTPGIAEGLYDIGRGMNEANMMRYPKDMQAPQLGMGGKIARPPDMAGLERGKTYGTDAYEAMRKDMEALAAEQAKPITMDMAPEYLTDQYGRPILNEKGQPIPYRGGIYGTEPSPGRPTMRPEALQGPERPGLGVGQGELPYPTPEAARTFQNQHQPYGAYSTAQPRVPQARPAPLEMPDAGAPATRVPGFQRDALQVMEARAIQEAVQAGIEKSGRAGPELGGVGKKGFRQGGAVDPTILPDSLNKLKEWVGRVLPQKILRGLQGEAIIVFRGSHGSYDKHGISGTYDPRFPRETQLGEPGKPNYEGRYAVFTTDNPYLASDYAVPPHERGILAPGVQTRTTANLVPFVLKPKRIIEFKGEGKFEFDGAARKLGKGEVLVWRDSYDWGPNSGWDHPLNRDRKPNDQYAFTDPKVAIPLYEAIQGKRQSSKPNPLVGGTGKKGFKQGGGWTPFAGKEQPKGPTFKEYKAELESLGMTNIPDAVIRKMMKKEAKKPKVANSPFDATKGVVEDISPTLLKETQDKYYNRRSAVEEAAELDKFAEAGGKDIWSGGAIRPPSYLADKHPILQWVNSKINDIFDRAHRESESIRIGSTVRGGRRSIDPNSPQGLWDKLNRQQKIDLNKLGNALTDRNVAYNPSSVREILGRELSPLEERTLKSIEGIGRWVLDILNEARKDKGLPELQGRNFYWTPAMWKGDYLYFVKDPLTKEVLHVFGTHFRPTSYMGRMLNRELNNALKDLGLKIDKNDFKRVTTPQEFSLSGIEVLFEREGRGKSERAQAVRDAIEKSLTDFEFRRARGHERRGRPGYRGSEEGWKGVREFEKVLDGMVTTASNIKANLEIIKLYRDMNSEKAAPSFEKFPNAMKAATKRIEDAMGHQWQGSQALDLMVANMLDSVGLPPSLVKKLVSSSGNLATRMLLGLLLPLQLIVQVFQPLYMLPKVTQQLGRAGKNPAMQQYILAKAILKGAFDTVTRPEYFNRLALEGTFTPTLRMEYTGFGSERFGTRYLDMFANLDKNTLAAVEAHVVRTPAAAIAYNALKEIGLKDKALDRVVRGLVDDYMVSFDRHKKSRLFANTGMLGDLFGRLQSFPLTWVAQFIEYTGKMFSRGEVAPFATFVGINVAVSGLTGLIGVKDADSFIEWLNTTMGLELPTATELILTETKSDAMRYGVVSAATGMNFGASMAAPTATGSMFAPALQLWQGLGRTLWQFGKTGYAKATGDASAMPTREDRREAVRGITPRVLHKYIEEPGLVGDALGTSRYGPQITDARGAGILERGPTEQIARGLGTFSLKEMEAKRMNAIARRHKALEADKRGSFYERFAQHVLQGGTWDGSWEQKAAKLHLDSQTLARGLREHINKKFLDPKQRHLRNLTTAQQQRMYQLYQELEGVAR